MYILDDLCLTEREYEILQYIKTMDSKALANRLGISPRTLQWHMTKLYAKFRVKNKYQLIVKLIDALPSHLVH